MSEKNEKSVEMAATEPALQLPTNSSQPTPQSSVPPTPNSRDTTPSSSVTGIPPASRLKAPTHFGGSTSSVSKIGRPCSHDTPKAGPPPRDHGAILTHNTEHFIIGQKVWVGGIRSGQIAFIGETHFAPGEWAGVVLDDPSGKNDGCVAGKRYFQCEPKRGIFSRLTRLTMSPLSGAQTPTSPLPKNSPDRSRTVSPTASIRSSFLRSPGKNGLTVGDRVIVSSGFGSRPGILRYLGETQFASGNWCGIELDESSGKNDGSVDGIRYFECKPKYGVFVPIAKVSLSPSSKKSRLSRTGSRESLTSIGTMNSIATTNTSRLRLNAQDLLREKQQHVEQLMIERDLDREDSQNTALQYQKNINELKTRVAHLERLLSEERKKAEDLQFSIDEATFCGDELNAQTQVYKEKIHELETKIKDLTSGKNASEETSATANAEVADLAEKLSEQAKLSEVRIAEHQDELQSLRENIKYLKDENETLQKELVAKDESLEKFSLSECGIENMRKELTCVKEEQDKERTQAQRDFTIKMEEKSLEMKLLLEENAVLKSSMGSVENDRKDLEDECRILREECKSRDTQVIDTNSQLAKIAAELSLKQAECATLDEIVKAQQLGKEVETTQLEEKIQEISKLKNEVTSLQETKSSLETNLEKANEELKKLVEIQNSIETKLKEAVHHDHEKETAIEALKLAMNELREECGKVHTENEQLKNSIIVLRSDLEIEASHKELTSKTLADKDTSLVEYSENLKKAQETIQTLEKDLQETRQSGEQNIIVKAQEIESLKEDLEKLQQKTSALEGESSVAVQQMSVKINQLESQNKRLVDDVKNSTCMIEDQRLKSIHQDEVIASKISELKSTATALENTSKLLEKLKAEQDGTLIKKQDLEEALKSTEDKNAQQQLDLGDLARKLESLTTKCAGLAVQNETLQQEVIAARTSSSTVHNDVKRLNEELQNKQNEISNLVSSIDRERNEMTGKLEELEQKLTNASNDYSDLKEVFQKSKEEISQKMQLIMGLEEKTIKQELLLSDSQRQHENLLSKYEALSKQNESLQLDLTTVRTSTTDSNAELIKLSQEITSKQKSYEDLMDKSNSERASLESQLQASQQRIDGMCSQVETLTQELKSVNEESFNRFELLKREQEKCGKQELEMGDLHRKLDSFVIKCDNMEEQNKALQNDLNNLRLGSAGSNAELVKLTEELTNKQKHIQQLSDQSNNDRLLFESQVQELKQSLQTQQSEMESLRNELKAVEVSKKEQLTEFESAKKELESKAMAELKELKEAESAKQHTIVESFEAQIKNAEHSKSKLDEAICSLQKQIQLLQDELLKSQLDFKTKEAEMQKQIEAFKTEREQLNTNFQKTKSEGSSALTNLQQENSRLLQSIEKLSQELTEKESSFVKIQSEAEQLRIMQSNTKSELELQLQKLSNALELSNADCEHQTKLVEEDKKKIEELKTLLEALKVSNENISATNSELAEALEVLEQEKCDTANIFELFELEADQNMEKLVEKFSSLKNELATTQLQLRTKETDIEEKQQQFNATDLALQNTQSSLDEAQNSILEMTTKLTELQQANKELQTIQQNTEEKLKQQEDLESQLAEYKKIFEEMDDSSSEKSLQLQQIQSQIVQLQQEKSKSIEKEQTLKIECSSIQRKLDMLEMEKTKEIVALKQRINDLQSISKLKQNGSGDSSSLEDSTGGDSTAQINFLNSIIADMQKKNDTLKAKIEALEALPIDFTKPAAFDLITKRKPAPRVFCDICDEFDKHETEDCPLQASDDRDYTPPPRAENNNNDPANKKERKLPEPRKYCESCEVFGHETGECDDECY